MLYLFTPDTEKTAALLALAMQDEFFAPIAKSLQDFGFEIRYPLFGTSGEYRPQALETNTEQFADAFLDAVAKGEMKAQFSFSPRFGRNAAAHYWLHELTHFWQDIHGLFLTPLQNGHIIQPDLKSHIEITLLCEAIAATEAIRASLRLKQKGLPQAWNGAFWSLDWHDLTKNYTKETLLSGDEEQAAQNCFERWYETPARKYYERRAFEGYKNHGQDFRAVNMGELVTLIPETERPLYLKRAKSRTNMDYKSCQNPNWQDIRIGSPPYVWHKLVNQ